ncbi:AAA family ATPase [Chryseobacterium sp. C3]|uniref:AAA family ATPase n=1 Tax=Chryseobacterium sp. C3 TaxID=2761532 RepID=UPI00162358E8|nr:AAA family ATPase [Chryseobacterium sp. C3]
MSNLENHNEFKLLAIRPLEGTSTELLKGLQQNYIYSFYSDYKYINENGKEIVGSDEYHEIENIKYTPIVPSNLYGENISISAIVGQNGSGKSSLLEIFYYFLFEYSRTEGLLESGTDVVKINSKEFHFEFYYLIDDEINCIEWDNINNFIKTSYKYNAENKTYERDSNTESFNKGDNYQIPIYNIVINYSIYGLNSNSDEDRWFDRLFIKNDGYQTPIVLNPYREDGNINVNREFELANSRLLKIFLSTSKESNDFNTSNLIKDISVDELLFKLDINKNLKLYLRSEHTEIETIVNTFESINEYKIKNFFNRLYTVFKKDIIFRDLRYVYSRYSFLVNENSFPIWMDLSNLYVFKKIIKIVHSYTNYKVFENIFIKVNIGDLKSNSNLRQLFVNQYFKLFLVDEQLNVVKIIEDAKKRSDFDIDELKIIEKSLLKYFYRFYEESFINDLYESDYINNIDTNNYISIYDSINNFLNKFNELLNSKEIKHRLIKLLLDKLATDFSHVTLKLRQVLNMQESNFFDNLVVTDRKNLSVHDDTQVIYFTVKKEYLSKSKNLSIEEIPNAFLEPIFKFNKSKANAPFELKYLSSGEQQLLHSTVSISYHIDNLLSILENKGFKLRSYQKINIILDEIELYNHPEYQREYIRNLVVLLSQQKYKGLIFNVILSTHSPFILSDIPSQNILKLKDGKPEPNDGINSFAANIYDLLKDEFFLKNGAIGAYASKKIANILENNVIQQEDINIINLIGDPFLKGVISKQIENKVSTEILNKEIMRLQKILRNRSENDTN